MKNFIILISLMILLYGLGFPATINITSPGAGENWHKGTLYTITWSKSGAMDARVKIRLLDSTGSRKILDIVDDTENDGSYPWTVPGSVPEGHYRIRVKTLDNAVWHDSDIFRISGGSAATGGISLDLPREGEVWEMGSSHRVKWSYRGTGDVQLELLQNSRVTGIIYSGPNRGIYRWHIKDYTNGTSIAPGNYQLKISVIGSPRHSDFRNIGLKTRGESYDFFIQEIGFDRTKKVFYLLLKNFGTSDYRGNLSFAFWFNQESGNPPPDKTFIKTVNLSPGRTTRVEMDSFEYARYDSCGIWVRAMVDYERLITELKENNNNTWKRVFTRQQAGRILIMRLGKRGAQKIIRKGMGTLEITPAMVTELPGMEPKGKMVETTFSVTVKNCGFDVLGTLGGEEGKPRVTVTQTGVYFSSSSRTSTFDSSREETRYYTLRQHQAGTMFFPSGEPRPGMTRTFDLRITLSKVPPRETSKLTIKIFHRWEDWGEHTPGTFDTEIKTKKYDSFEIPITFRDFQSRSAPD